MKISKRLDLCVAILTFAVVGGGAVAAGQTVTPMVSGSAVLSQAEVFPFDKYCIVAIGGDVKK